jgi:hypothetical protein
MNLGAPELLIVLLSFLPLAIIIWGVADAATRPDWAWQSAGQNKAMWIILQVVGAVLCGIVGLILAIVYLVSIRPQVAAHQG